MSFSVVLLEKTASLTIQQRQHERKPDHKRYRKERESGENSIGEGKIDGAAGDGSGDGRAGREKYMLLYRLYDMYVCMYVHIVYNISKAIYILCIISVRHSFLCGPFHVQQKPSKQHFTHLLNHIN